jgi:RNase P subunit RPR2
MALILRLAVKQIFCTTCLRVINEQNQVVMRLVLRVFGSNNLYAICPECLQETPYAVRHDEEYRRRHRVKMYERFNMVAKYL